MFSGDVAVEQGAVPDGQVNVEGSGLVTVVKSSPSLQPQIVLPLRFDCKSAGTSWGLFLLGHCFSLEKYVEKGTTLSSLSQ